MSCSINPSSINQTFIIEPLSLTGGAPTISACTSIYTNNLISCSGDTQIFMGTGIITFDGSIYTNQDLSATTINASTYFSGGTNLIDIINSIQITGGTFNNVTDTLTLEQTNGNQINVTGFTDYYTTGSTLIGDTVYFDRTDLLSAYTVNLSSLNVDTYVTGVTFNNNQLIITRNDGVSLNTFINSFTGLTINGSLSATTYYGDGSNLTGIPNTFTTGATYSNGFVYFDRNDILSAYTLNLSVLTGDTNTFVTGGTVSGNTLELFRNDGVQIDIDLSEVSFSGGSGNCITNLYVTNVHGCSPITFHDTLRILNGLTVTGTSIFDTISAVTLSATTYLNLPIDVFVTGGTYNAGTATFTNSTGGTFSVTGFSTSNTTAFTGGTVTGSTNFTGGLTANTFSATTYLGLPMDVYSTGLTINNATYDLQIIRNDGVILTANLGTLASDVNITGGTYNNNTGVVTFYNNTGGTFNVSGFTTGMTDTTVTSFNYNNANKFTIGDSTGGTFTASINTVTGLTVNGSLSASTYLGLPIDVRVTGGTYSAGTAVFTNNTGGTFNVSGFSTGSSVTLQQAYNNSSNPEITTNSTVGSLTIKDGVGSGTTVFEVISTGSTNLISVAGDGITSVGSNVSIDGKDVSYYPITIRSNRNDLTRMQILNGGATQTDLQIATNNGSNAIYYGVSSTNNAFIDNRTTGNLLFQNTGVSQMTFNTVGDFGIGENTPTSKLHIKGSGTTSSGYALKVDDNSSNPLLYVRNDRKVGVGNLATGSTFSVSSNNSDIFRTSAVGTYNASILESDNYSSSLSINSAVNGPIGGYNSGLYLNSNGVNRGSFNAESTTSVTTLESAGGYWLLLKNSTTESIGLGQGGNYIQFNTNGTSKMLIDGPTGNVAIGNPIFAPTAKLHVSGNTLINGNLTADTISATTYLGLPIDVRVTGGTYNAGTATFRNNTGGTFSVTGFSTGSTAQSFNDVLTIGATATTKDVYLGTGRALLSSNGGGSLKLDYGSTGNTISLTNDRDAFLKSYIYYQDNLYGYNNNSSYITSDTSANTVTGYNVLGVVSTDVGLFKAAVEVTSTYSNMFYKNNNVYIDNSFIKFISPNTTVSNNLVLSANSINTIAYHDASKVLKSATLGAGLSLVGGSLNTTGVFTGLTATTISATTYLNLPIDVRVTGGTGNNSTKVYTFTNNTGGTFSVTGLTDVAVTGATGNDSTKIYTFTNNTGGTFTVNSLTDVRVTGGTYSNGTTTFVNNTGGTFTITGFSTGNTFTDVRVTGATGNDSTKVYTFTNNTGGTFTLNALTDLTITGGTPNNSTKIYTFTNNTGGTFNVTALTDVAVTGGTYTAGTATFTNNTGGTFSVTGFSTGSTFVDVRVTGGTPNDSTKIYTFTNNTGGTFNVTALTDVRVTGGTYNAGTATFTNSTGGTFSVTGFVTGDTYTTGFTYNNANQFTLTNNTGGTLSIIANTVTGLTVTKQIDFSTGNTIPTNVSGRVFYNSIEQALAYYPNANQDVIVNIGQQQYIRVNNASGVLIPKGSVLTTISASGGTPSVTLAIASGSTSNNIIGMAAHNIGIGEQGLVINRGLLSGLTVNTFSVGDQIYLSDTVAGTYINNTSNLATSSRINNLGYITATGTTLGQIFVNIVNENSNESLTIKQKNLLATNSLSTGLYSFTGMSKISSTTFSIAPVSGWIVKNTGAYALTGSVVNVLYSGTTGLTTPYLATADNTHVLITSANTVTLQTSHPTDTQRRYNIFLGTIIHPNRTSIDSVINSPDFDVSPISQLRDVMSPINLINQGVVASSNGATLSFKTSAGILYGLGLGWVTDNDTPNSVVITATTPTTFKYRTSTGGTYSNVTVINPTNYDVGGVVTSIPGGINVSTNQRIYLFPNNTFYVQYGQTTYTSLTNAIAGLDTEAFTANSNLADNGILIGIISVRRGATDLSLSTDAKFTFSSKFGEVFGGTGGISTTTLQQAYNNSSTPEIIINATLDGLSIQNGTGNPDITTHLIEGQNTAGSITSFITANGGFSANTITASTVSAVTISATTYVGLPTDVYVTGGTYNTGTTVFTNNTGGTFTITGFSTGSTFTDVRVTGGTANNSTKVYTFTNNTGGTFNLSALTDLTITGGTYNAGTATFTNSTGGTFSVTGFSTGGGGGGDSITGGTYNNTTGTLSLNSTASTITITGFTTGNTFTTGFTYSNNVATIKQNQGQPDLSIVINTMTGLTVNGGLSAFTFTASSINLTGTTSGQEFNLYRYSNDANAGGILSYKARGTSGTPTAVLSGDTIAVMGGRGYDGTGFTISSKANISFVTSENWSSTNQGTYLSFNATASGSTTRSEVMKVDSTGLWVNGNKIVSGTSVSASTYYGDGTYLTGVAHAFTGTTTLNFDSFISGETSYTTTAVTNSNITSSSTVMFRVIPSTNHPTVEESLIEGLTFMTSDIVDGVGFTINSYASQDTWGIYNVFYRIIN